VTTFAETYLRETAELVDALDRGAIEALASALAAVRDRGGRLFVLGVGGSAGHPSHAVNDFRKLCALEAYAPTDNVSELTARTNDEGWETTFVEWLRGSRLRELDGVLVFSVGGGDAARGVSANLVRALELAREAGAAVLGIVGRDGGATAELADACVVIPPLVAERITPHTEGLCAVVWHLLVSHPSLQAAPTRWEARGLPPEVVADLSLHPDGRGSGGARRGRRRARDPAGRRLPLERLSARRPQRRREPPGGRGADADALRLPPLHAHAPSARSGGGDDPRAAA